MATVSVLILLGVAIVGTLAADEIRAWLPYLTRKNMAKAIFRLPPDLRARYAEEWQSDIQEKPGPISRFVFSLGLLKASSGICRICGMKRGVSLRSVAKRCLNVSFAALALVWLAPLFLMISVFIKLESPGPVLVKFPRVGENGKPFEMLRFRTACFLGRASEPRFEMTHIGSLLRRFSLDEIPGIINVLRGEMSINGPRPSFRV